MAHREADEEGSHAVRFSAAGASGTFEARAPSEGGRDALEVLSLPWCRRADRRSLRRRRRLRPGARAHQPGAGHGALEALLRRREPERQLGRPRVLHGRSHHRSALRRRAGLLALSVDRVARAYQVGDPGERARRAPHLRARAEQRSPRLAVDERRADRRRVQHHESLRHHPRLQPADRRAAQRHRREHDGPSLVRARVLPRRLVAEPRDRRVRLRQLRARHRAGQRQVRPDRLLLRGSERPQRARLRRERRVPRRHDEGLRDSADGPDALRPPRRLRGLRLAPEHDVQPGGAHGPQVVQARGRRRFRARGLGRQQDGRLDPGGSPRTASGTTA